MARKQKAKSEVIPPYMHRLQDSQSEYEDEAYSKGLDIGLAWAKETAAYGQLKRMAAVGTHRDVQRLREQLGADEVWQALFADVEVIPSVVQGFTHATFLVFSEFDNSPASKWT